MISKSSPGDNVTIRRDVQVVHEPLDIAPPVTVELARTFREVNFLRDTNVHTPRQSDIIHMNVENADEYDYLGRELCVEIVLLAD